MNYLFSIKKKLGPTINGKKPLLSLTKDQKTEILRTIRKDWSKLLDLHFENEGGISDGKVLYKWKPLSERHRNFKTQEQFSSSILEMTKPSLLTRYKKNISYNSNTFNIYINYPILNSGSQNNKIVNAGIHQLGREYSQIGKVQRRIILKDFKAIAKKRVLEYLTKNL